VTYSYETEVFPYFVARKYKPDFIFHNTGILVECKGRFTGADRSKTLNVRSSLEQEGWELRFLFQKPYNKLSPKSETTYAAWCDKHDFIWAQGPAIPEDWYV
jgi:hypothetical protein